MIVDKLTYKFSDPERGDVVVFDAPTEDGRYFIKRVIGLPGETVNIHNKIITVTSKDSPEVFTINEPVLDVPTQGEVEVTLKSDEYFVLGDNRPVSSDSRVWGSLDRKLIAGRPIVRLLPINTLSVLPGIYHEYTE